MTNTDFSDANLYETIFSNTTITDQQLKSALSVQDTLLPNGTRSHGKNLISNGKANCNISRTSSWILRNGNIMMVLSNHTSSYCEFILPLGSTGATIYKRIELSNHWNSILWPYSQVVLRANISTGVSMELNGISSDDHIIAQQTLSKFRDTKCTVKYVLYM